METLQHVVGKEKCPKGGGGLFDIASFDLPPSRCDSRYGRNSYQPNAAASAQPTRQLVWTPAENYIFSDRRQVPVARM